MSYTKGPFHIFRDVIALENGTTHIVQVLTVEDKLGHDEEVAYCFDVNHAELIVRAVNTHAQLLEALEGVVHHNGAVKPHYQLPSSLMRQIEQALAAAQGKD